MRLDARQALARLQQTELEILEVFAAYCTEHELVWFLDSGTDLGAMRHGGFIPWDDDIDVGMLRADYDRFLELSLGEKPLPSGYSVHTYDNTPGYASFFAKVYKDGTVFATAETEEAGCPQAVFIDIFPYDAVSADEQRAASQRFRARHAQSLAYLFHSGAITVPDKGLKGDLERWACRGAHHVVKAARRRETIKEQYYNAIDLAGTEASEFVTIYPWPRIYKISTLVPTAPVVFEGREFPGPADQEEFLKIKYGAWRKLPAPEDRKTHLPRRIDFGDGDWFES